MKYNTCTREAPNITETTISFLNFHCLRFHSFVKFRLHDMFLDMEPSTSTHQRPQREWKLTLPLSGLGMSNSPLSRGGFHDHFPSSILKVFLPFAYSGLIHAAISSVRSYVYCLFVSGKQFSCSHKLPLVLTNISHALFCDALWTFRGQDVV